MQVQTHRKIGPTSKSFLSDEVVLLLSLEANHGAGESGGSSPSGREVVGASVPERMVDASEASTSLARAATGRTCRLRRQQGFAG